MKRVAIIGGGITGLAAAVEVRERGGRPTLFEASKRLGGQIRSERDGDYLLEAGPDSFLRSKPGAAEFCHLLGLDDELVDAPPGAPGTRILHRGRLLPLPEGFLVMAPTRLGPALRSPLFSLRGKLRLALEPWVAAAGGRDESLGAFVTRRFGREVLERVTEPMLASLFTADADRLSLEAVMPQFLELEASEGSVTRGLQRRGGPPGRHAGGRVAATYVRGGLERLCAAAVQHLAGEDLRTERAVRDVAPTPEGRWSLRADGLEAETFDAVVLACPAWAAAAPLAKLAPSVAEELGALPYASCATVSLAYPREALPAAEGLGFFVPRGERLPILAASFTSEKFEGRAPASHRLLRTFVGGALQPERLDEDDDTLIRHSHESMARVLGARTEPSFARVFRYPNAMPQYPVGFRATRERIVDGLRALGALEIAGSCIGAIGLPDCIRTGREAANRALADS